MVFYLSGVLIAIIIGILAITFDSRDLEPEVVAVMVMFSLCSWFIVTVYVAIMIIEYIKQRRGK